MTKKSWAKMNTEEKLEALRADIAESANFVNRLTSDMRELNARLTEAMAEIRVLRSKEA